jgi:hypothetical protein
MSSLERLSRLELGHLSENKDALAKELTERALPFDAAAKLWGEIYSEVEPLMGENSEVNSKLWSEAQERYSAALKERGLPHPDSN